MYVGDVDEKWEELDDEGEEPRVAVVVVVLVACAGGDRDWDRGRAISWVLRWFKVTVVGVSTWCTCGVSPGVAVAVVVCLKVCGGEGPAL